MIMNLSRNSYSSLSYFRIKKVFFKFKKQQWESNHNVLIAQYLAINHKALVAVH